MNAVVDRAETAVIERVENIDFKMVTFSLAGKDYSIDIMKVREISKATRFTYVPNSLPYVRGVYNLRGDIISIIDLRTMFNLPLVKSEKKSSDELIILRLDGYLLGVIVDSIEKVVGISSSAIQPPHPIFGDINIKFIQGVVEKDNKLYIILDVESIFGQNADNVEVVPTQYTSKVAYTENKPEEINMGFISETLRTFSKFNVTDLNNKWVENRFEEWKKLKGKNSEDLQLHSERDSEEFLSRFYSTDTGRFWSEEYRNLISSLLENNSSGTIRAWNPGCGKGYETYSIATLLSEKFKEASIKIWANDKDLMSISNAPNLALDKQNLPKYMDKHIISVNSKSQFNQKIKDIVLFEYHDITHPNTFPTVDIIVARDILSFLGYSEQLRMIAEFQEKLVPGGLLIIGQNEELPVNDWKKIKNNNITAYRKIV
ncbi:MAG: chemotaxis protein CheW [Spirochaetia bacterium]|jgi:purine-binding chemotaxis protein CheW|nr:chemotaxis protein CheW [Spirochaetia bacterium]